MTTPNADAEERRARRTVIEVATVHSRADLREFRRVPRLLRGADERWVEPLRSEQAGLLDRARHPFWVDVRALAGGRGRPLEIAGGTDADADAR